MAHVLVLDDSEDLRLLFSMALEEDGHEVVACADGTAGLAAMARRAPDVVVLDWGLPGVSGLDVMRRMRADGHPARVIMVTGRAGPHGEADVLRAGADEFVLKPVLPRTLRAIVRSVLERPGAGSG